MRLFIALEIPPRGEHMALFKSTLPRGGASYEEIYHVELREPERHDVE